MNISINKSCLLHICMKGLLPAFLFIGVEHTCAQSAIDAMQLARPDMKGTARYMSMGGAFGALGGDLTTLSMNPAGIGVYRNHEVGVTVDLNAISTSSTSSAGKFTTTKTPFLLNNIGGVLTLRLNSDACPNLNFGFTYNRTASFHNKYGGGLGNLGMSMTNWMAGIANKEEVTVADVSYSGTFNPYNPNDGGYAAPWMSILGYQSFLINPIGDPDSPDWQGLYGNGTSGTASYSVEETGGIDSFNIAFGGNIANLVYWGMDFDISNLNYTRNTFYGENLDKAYVAEGENGEIGRTTANWNLQNWYNVSGTGFTYKLGMILRPIQELRLGVAFHTPTYYSLTQQFSGMVNATYNGTDSYTKYTNADSRGNWEPGYNDFRFVAPWKVMISAAGVIKSKFIISADYQWDLTSKMHFKDPSYYYYGYEIGFGNDYGNAYFSEANSYNPTNQDIQNYYSDIHTLRVGAEYRVTKNFSVRAGYSNVSSGVKQDASDGRMIIYTAGTMPEYSFSNSTNYYTAGLGYRTGGFYADLAYVNKQNTSKYHAFSGDPATSSLDIPSAKVKFTSNQVVLSLGYKF